MHIDIVVMPIEHYMFNDAHFVHNVVMSNGYYIVMSILCMYARYSNAH